MKEELGRLDIATIVSGGAAGADRMAERYSREVLGRPPQVFAPQKRYGAARFAMRNRQIVEAADMVVAFWDGASPGTRMTIGMARKAKKPLRVVRYNQTPEEAEEAETTRNIQPNLHHFFIPSRWTEQS